MRSENELLEIVRRRASELRARRRRTGRLLGTACVAALLAVGVVAVTTGDAPPKKVTTVDEPASPDEVPSDPTTTLSLDDQATTSTSMAPDANPPATGPLPEAVVPACAWESLAPGVEVTPAVVPAGGSVRVTALLTNRGDSCGLARERVGWDYAKASPDAECEPILVVYKEKGTIGIDYSKEVAYQSPVDCGSVPEYAVIAPGDTWRVDVEISQWCCEGARSGTPLEPGHYEVQLSWGQIDGLTLGSFDVT